ncbi:SUMO-like ubiquitin activating enzyme [Hamiltosporidium tvaerminnensis]|uniref:Ubiquitin-activating enzyme E1-like n=1 Tax=Hamiltosporidium tvaerminnensis TaxID=1176355 RepID=A0A4Q9M210_9MICR|nr:SUMO-like ubiquitin activating enzyme [Hamiltosporidium tvaerminnensis]
MNVLIIGCGGIGCELLKQLYLSNFKRITLVDNDTISFSNLNRQFFFTRKDINKYKSEICKKKFIKKFPDAEISVIKNSILDYNLEFFLQFDVVFNCLDNIEARSYVSMRCVFGNVLLIDGGTNGLKGQSEVYGKIGCFDCVEKEVIEYPVCSIKTNPTKYEHCVVWAKEYFFKEVFSNKIFDKNTLLKIITNQNTENISEDTFPEFGEPNDSKKIESSENILGGKFSESEEPTNSKKMKIESTENISADTFPEFCEPTNSKKMKIESTENISDGKFYKYEEPNNSKKIKKNTEKLYKNLYKNNQSDCKKLIDTVNHLLKNKISDFDKDNQKIIDFIYYSAKLRSKYFNINSKDEFETKSIAGNIIPAVCTTNSIISSLMMFSLKSKMNYYIVGNRKLISKVNCYQNKECICTYKKAIIFGDKIKISMIIKKINELFEINDLKIYDGDYLLYDKYFKDFLENEIEFQENKFLVVKNCQTGVLLYTKNGGKFDIREVEDSN